MSAEEAKRRLAVSVERLRTSGLQEQCPIHAAPHLPSTSGNLNIGALYELATLLDEQEKRLTKESERSEMAYVARLRRVEEAARKVIALRGPIMVAGSRAIDELAAALDGKKEEGNG